MTKSEEEPPRTPTAVVILIGPEDELVLGRLVDLVPDVSLVDALARLQLAARRLGCAIALREPCEGLCEVLDLVGMTELLEDPSSVLESIGEPERGEQGGVEEVVDPDDPIV